MYLSFAHMFILSVLNLELLACWAHDWLFHSIADFGDGFFGL